MGFLTGMIKKAGPRDMVNAAITKVAANAPKQLGGTPYKPAGILGPMDNPGVIPPNTGLNASKAISTLTGGKGFVRAQPGVLGPMDNPSVKPVAKPLFANK
jgi:hypothetical protein